MSQNNRIFYACQAVGIKPCFTNDPIEVVHGAQSVGINTTFNLEQVFELGMIQIFENIEGLPDVEVTTEKVIDGYALVYHLATPKSNGTNITARSKDRSCVSLGIYSDEQDVVSGIAPVEVYTSGMYVSSISYTLPVDGNSTESVTLVGNNKEWYAQGHMIAYHNDNATNSNPVGFGEGGTMPEDEYRINYDSFTGEDEPLALDTDPTNPAAGPATRFLGGVQRRENVRIDRSIFPKSVYGVRPNGEPGNAFDFVTSGNLVHFQNCSISTDTSREDINELGRKGPYTRAPNFPVEVTCDLEAIAISGDFVNAYENGDPSLIGTKGEGNNTIEETIKIHLNDGTCFDLGKKNRLESVSYGGGDAGGGNVSLNYSYKNFNDLRVLHPEDPIVGNYSVKEQADVDTFYDFKSDAGYTGVNWA